LVGLEKEGNEQSKKGTRRTYLWERMVSKGGTRRGGIEIVATGKRKSGIGFGVKLTGEHCKDGEKRNAGRERALSLDWRTLAQ